jgi:uncharacterized protein
VKLADSNVLIYAVHEEARHHRAALAWLDGTLSAGEAVIMPWLSLASFMRVSTHPDIYPRPLPIEDALENVDAWLGVPSVITGDPDRHHSHRMRELLSYSGIGGNLVNDAHLAALALQYGATVVTYDHDFALFPSVRWERPPPVGNN